ncbi:F0F1 ATP synthase subunit A [Propionibacteriaceae bacterium G1746]|uniref:F0F1 ATP synthase subunit A n=1 Tax=Aestuariimicrobium sp. G57 TaxID=3418485 RepID=UPI003C2794BD
MQLSPFVPLEGSGWPPGVHSFDYPGLFGTTWLNKPMLQAFIAALLIIVFWVATTRNLKIMPSKGQFLVEYIYDFVRNGIARDLLGHDYRKFLPFLLMLFSWTLVNNWFGELFLFMLPTMSKIGYAYALALLAWIVYVGAGFWKHGAKYIKMQLIPDGVPVYLYPIIIPLEFLSNFIVRPFTLALRLFANMFAGHLVVMVFVIGGEVLLTTQDNLFYNVAGGASLIFSFAILFLELFIGALQAYIFTVLTAQYISSSIADAH